MGAEANILIGLSPLDRSKVKYLLLIIIYYKLFGTECIEGYFFNILKKSLDLFPNVFFQL